jgi:hypothetical protein
MAKSALLKRLNRIRTQVKDKKYRPAFPDLKVEGSHDLSNNLKTKGAFKQDKLRDHLWRKGREEKPATVEEMERKAKRIRPKFGKGAYEYATDGDNQGEIRIYRK